MHKFSIYLHIPFCIKKCEYCDFLSFSGHEGEYEKYVEKLCEEMEISSAQYKDAEAVTVFIGGGTPTALHPRQLDKLLKSLRKNYKFSPEIEFTIEANPETLDLEKLELLIKHGVNRLSMGVQSMDNRLLEILGRAHSFQKFADVYKLARKAGFVNINPDLMFGLPEQSMEDWENTLRMAVAFEPEHISCYSLMLEEGSKFGKRTNLVLPSEETEREMYYLAKKMLKLHGYEQYEISNFSKPGLECRHNTVYWTMKEYISFGLGAHSFSNDVRYQNTNSIDEYLSGDFSHRELIKLSDKDKYSEFMFLGLRLCRGVREEDFRSQFNISMYKLFGEKIRALESKGLITDDGVCIALTSKGMDLSNMVFVEMLLD